MTDQSVLDSLLSQIKLMIDIKKKQGLIIEEDQLDDIIDKTASYSDITLEDFERERILSIILRFATQKIRLSMMTMRNQGIGTAIWKTRTDGSGLAIKTICAGRAI